MMVKFFVQTKMLNPVTVEIMTKKLKKLKWKKKFLAVGEASTAIF